MANIYSKKKIFIWIGAVVLLLAICVLACAIYVSDYYHADVSAIDAFKPMSEVSEKLIDDGVMVFGSDNSRYGFIFYPGGKVEHTAYIPLMRAIASNGVLCILVDMPFNLAVLDVNAAEGYPERYPKVDSWYIGGHSLGGSMAATYASENTELFDGLVLLGSYSTADLSASMLNVLSIYGSEDTVLNREKYDKYKNNLPDSMREVVIDGGCHAYFGFYGAQKGDGEPTITAEEQIAITAEYVADMIIGRE